MKIAVGSKNAGKIEAVKMGLAYYEEFKNAEVEGVNADSGVANQPIGLEEILTGAKNRARAALEISGAELGFGLESGIFKVPHTKSDYMDTTACAIYDGKNYHVSLSSCFEYPREMIRKLLEEGKEVTEAAIEMGFTDDPKFREGQGMVGVLSRGVISRIKYSEQAVIAAVIHLINPKHY